MKSQSNKEDKMADIGELLAPYRTAIWFDVRNNYLLDMARLWYILQRLSSLLHWDSISPSEPSVLSVYFGSIVDHQFTLQEVGQEMVWCAIIGAPDAKTRVQIQSILEESKLDGLIRLDLDPPPPSHPSYSLILYGILTHETLIRMEAVSKQQRRYESVIGLETVYPRDETEVVLLTALSGEEALPTLLRVMGRNLRRWINEPKLGPTIDVNRLIQHAYELRHIGAIRAAGVAAGTALEAMMIQWSHIPIERVRTKKIMLGTLIMEAQKLMMFTDETCNELLTFSNLRAKCAHAVVVGSIGDDDLLEEVDRFLNWLSKAQVKEV